MFPCFLGCYKPNGVGGVEIRFVAYVKSNNQEMSMLAKFLLKEPLAKRFSKINQQLRRALFESIFPIQREFSIIVAARS